MPRVIEIDVPEYRVDAEPDDKAIGTVIDAELKKYFLGQSVLIRGVASSEHPDKSREELVEIILQTGTDRYNPQRAGDRYENIEGKHIDLFAFPATITASSAVAHQLIWGFYHSAIAVHGYPVRIDVITVYDAKQFDQITHQYEGRDDIKDDGFAFKDPAHKQDALLGIVILKP